MPEQPEAAHLGLSEPGTGPKTFPRRRLWVVVHRHPNLPPDRTQPGGWIFNILPFIEQQALHDLAYGLAGAAKNNALA